MNELYGEFPIVLSSALMNLIFSQVYNGENELISSAFNMALPVSLEMASLAEVRLDFSLRTSMRFP